jgi:hypothetical protein
MSDPLWRFMKGSAHEPRIQIAKKVATDLGQFDQDQQYITDNYDELLALHRDQWIGVYDGKVVAVAANIEELLTAVEEHGLPPENVARRKITGDKQLVF